MFSRALSDYGLTPGQEVPQTNQRRMHVSIGHHIGIECDVDDAIVECDIVPIRQRSLAASIIGTAPIPYAQ